MKGFLIRAAIVIAVGLCFHFMMMADKERLCSNDITAGNMNCDDTSMFGGRL